jgi:hypothetical protein
VIPPVAKKSGALYFDWKKTLTALWMMDRSPDDLMVETQKKVGWTFPESGSGTDQKGS